MRTFIAKQYGNKPQCLGIASFSDSNPSITTNSTSHEPRTHPNPSHSWLDPSYIAKRQTVPESHGSGAVCHAETQWFHGSCQKPLRLLRLQLSQPSQAAWHGTTDSSVWFTVTWFEAAATSRSPNPA